MKISNAGLFRAGVAGRSTCEKEWPSDISLVARQETRVRSASKELTPLGLRPARRPVIEDTKFVELLVLLWIEL